jgi:hypothetical protein
MELFREWHKVRLSLEKEWKAVYPDYEPVYSRKLKDLDKKRAADPFLYYLNFFQGHCRKTSYIPNKFPGAFKNSSAESLF